MILVTGGTGLVGSHLLYFLTKENDRVRAIYRSEEKLKKVKKVFSYYTDDFLIFFNKIEWVKADITDVPSLYNAFDATITHVYHCAAIVSFDRKDYLKMRKTNIEGTANIVNFCIAFNVRKMCHVSSIATLGESLNEKLISEENEWNDQEENYGYAITKYGAEMEVWRASQEGVEVVIVNPGVILGSGFFNEGSGKMFSQVYNGFKFYTEGITGFVGVKDVVLAMIRLTKSDIKSERFILVSENKSFREILNAIAKAFQKPQPSIKVHKLLTELFWRIDWFVSKITGKERLLTKNSATSAHQKSYYTSEKIKKELNFDFEKMGTVIKRVCKNYSL